MNVLSNLFRFESEIDYPRKTCPFSADYFFYHLERRVKARVLQNLWLRYSNLKMEIFILQEQKHNTFLNLGYVK